MLVAVVPLAGRDECGRVSGARASAPCCAPGLVALPALVLPFLIRAAVVEGVATATEVSTVGIAYTSWSRLLVYRRFDLARLWPMLVDTAALSGAILLIIGMATAMAWALTQSGFSTTAGGHMMVRCPAAAPGSWRSRSSSSPCSDRCWRGFRPSFCSARCCSRPRGRWASTTCNTRWSSVLSMGLGLFAPPFGIGFYVSCAIGGASPDAAMRRIWPYLGALLVAVIVVAAVPWISIGFL